MPSNFMAADSSFPTFSQGQSQDEKIRIITNYLYQLLEQLRYTLANLGQENFNETELNNIAGLITKPLYLKIEDDEGAIAQLQIDASGLLSRMSDAEGNVSSLTQTVNGLSLSASNGSSSSTLTLSSNGVTIDSAVVRFTGVVTFNALQTAGQTVINGDNITTGEITGRVIKSILNSDDGSGNVSGETQFLYKNYSTPAGGIRLDDQGAGSATDGKYRMFLYTRTVGGQAFNLKLESAGGMSLDSDGLIYEHAGTRLELNAGTYIDLSAGGNIYLRPGSGSKVYIGSQTLDSYIQSVVNSMNA